MTPPRSRPPLLANGAGWSRTEGISRLLTNNHYLGRLRRRCHSAFLTGSVARGWEHQLSDVDLCVILPTVTAHTSSELEVSTDSTFVEGRRWDVEFWPSDVPEKLAHMVTELRRGLPEATGEAISRISSFALGRALRLADAVPLIGEESVDRDRARIHSAGLTAVVANVALSATEAAIEDAHGLLAVKAERAAVLAAQSAFGHAVDAYSALRGEVTPGDKWRLHRLENANAAEVHTQLRLDREAVWRRLTLQGAVEDGIERWVVETLELCQKICWDIRLSWTMPAMTYHDASAAGGARTPFLSARDEEAALAAQHLAAMAVVVSPEGIILHHRDDKEGIAHPGCWSLFGGAVEAGETPHEALVRELREEIGVDAAAATPLCRVLDFEGDGRLVVVFEVRTEAAASELALLEGQGLAAVSLEDAATLNLAPFCRRVLSYLEGRRNDQC